ncbi:hypothetical protein [Methylorubrum aminovorans]|uniref:hypothetical protein n=1 Tax=Methylorubrum aminovorans TaxID=269069 RepID=UPI001EDE5CC5|nr:hypothetical protein [Methylorubrum aminovorans]
MEREEEAVIRSIAEEGIPVERRPDASPEAVLQVRVAASAVEALIWHGRPRSPRPSCSIFVLAWTTGDCSTAELATSSQRCAILSSHGLVAGSRLS